MDVNDALNKKRSDEKNLRKRIDLLLQNADKAKGRYLKDSKTQSEMLESVRIKQQALSTELKKLQARISAIIDLDPSYDIQSISSDMPLKDSLHQEVYNSKLKLLDIERDQGELNSKYAQINLNILSLKDEVNTELDTIEPDVEELKTELAENLTYQEKLKNVINPEYNMKSTVVKELENESSNTYLIIALVCFILTIPIFGPVSIIATVATAYKLYKNKTVQSRLDSHKDRF